MTTVAVPTSTPTQIRESSLLARYSGMPPQAYQEELDKTWAALQEIKDVIGRNVQEGNLRSIDAAKAISSVTGSVFGYEEFHPRGGVDSMLSTLFQATQKQNDK